MRRILILGLLSFGFISCGAIDKLKQSFSLEKKTEAIHVVLSEEYNKIAALKTTVDRVLEIEKNIPNKEFYISDVSIAQLEAALNSLFDVDSYRNYVNQLIKSSDALSLEKEQQFWSQKQEHLDHFRSLISNLFEREGLGDLSQLTKEQLEARKQLETTHLVFTQLYQKLFEALERIGKHEKVVQSMFSKNVAQGWHLYKKETTHGYAYEEINLLSDSLKTKVSDVLNIKSFRSQGSGALNDLIRDITNPSKANENTEEFPTQNRSFHLAVDSQILGNELFRASLKYALSEWQKVLPAHVRLRSFDEDAATQKMLDDEAKKDPSRIQFFVESLNASLGNTHVLYPDGVNALLLVSNFPEKDDMRKISDPIAISKQGHGSFTYEYLMLEEKDVFILNQEKGFCVRQDVESFLKEGSLGTENVCLDSDERYDMTRILTRELGHFLGLNGYFKDPNHILNEVVKEGGEPYHWDGVKELLEILF
ncbi:MAG: hypothetical protein HYW47_07355 [Deltaproteobacteria bacterium]|nr:hypothetical protein [Deltaproteobacteria bacterium]